MVVSGVIQLWATILQWHLNNGTVFGCQRFAPHSCTVAQTKTGSSFSCTRQSLFKGDIRGLSLEVHGGVRFISASDREEWVNQTRVRDSKREQRPSIQTSGVFTWIWANQTDPRWAGLCTYSHRRGRFNDHLCPPNSYNLLFCFPRIKHIPQWLWVASIMIMVVVSDRIGSGQYNNNTKNIDSSQLLQDCAEKDIYFIITPQTFTHMNAGLQSTASH